MTIPIVFLVAADPVERGLVASYNRPGGNVTGFTSGTYEDKRLETLKSCVPSLATAGWLCDCKADRAAAVLNAGRRLGIQDRHSLVYRPDDFERAFADAVRAGVDGIALTDMSWTGGQFGRVAELALRHRLPSVGPSREFVELGGLLYYGPVPGQGSARAAAFVDKILKGTRPAAIPVELPTRFELVVNLRTARALNLKIPDSFFYRVDRVIE